MPPLDPVVEKRRAAARALRDRPTRDHALDRTKNESAGAAHAIPPSATSGRFMCNERLLKVVLDVVAPGEGHGVVLIFRGVR